MDAGYVVIKWLFKGLNQEGPQTTNEEQQMK